MGGFRASPTTIGLRSAAGISPDSAVMGALAARLRDRAADPDRRVDTPRTGFDNRDGAGAASLGSMLASVVDDLGSIMRAAHAGAVEPGIRDRPRPTFYRRRRPPMSPRLRHSWAGRCHPDLRWAYLLVADGGFGPRGGLMSLGTAVRTWQTLRRESPGPRGSHWPERLLPIVDDEGQGDYDCVALDTGEVIAWDADGLTEFGRVAWIARSRRSHRASARGWRGGSVHRRSRNVRPPRCRPR
jgi:hypothetical protein